MKLLISLFTFLVMTVALADSVKVEVSPSKPVAGEVFQLYFRIFTEVAEEPNIIFSAGAVEVVGKANQGVSTRTVYANGKLTVTRELTVVYDLITQRTGSAFIRDIKVQLGSKTLTHPVIALTVLREPEIMPEVFIMADVPKKDLYVGEGIVVRYYIYSKGHVSNVDIRKYPKLNSFLKRFLQEPERTERVSVDGQIYQRTQIYAAKLFAEKPGELKIDSMELNATYPNIRPGDPFGAFGMSRDYKTKTISSKTEKVHARPLPKPIPDNYMGLVGKHDIQIQFGQHKLIVNEPLEVRLTVSGGGALENLEAPKILEHPSLEEFETNGDLKLASADQATKTFDYTFLPKEDVKLPATTLVLTYFDLDQEKYVPIELQIPEIEIAGGAKNTRKKEEKEPKKEEGLSGKASTKLESPKLDEVAGPILRTGQSYRTWLPYFNAALAALSVLIAMGWFVRRRVRGQEISKHGIPAQFRKGNFSLREFTVWLSPLIQKTGKSPSAIIKESMLDEATKSYFIDLLQANDYKDYSARKMQSEFTYDSAHFKKLGRYIESAKNENSSQSS